VASSLVLNEAGEPVIPLSIVMTSLPDATAGVAYSGQATASGGVLPYSYAKTTGPSWMTVNASTGAITGTPDADGTGITVTVTVTDADLTEEPVTDTMDVAFTPYVLFLSAEKGGWYDIQDLSSMFQDSAGTTPAAVDAVVGKVNDKSGNGYHLIQATTSLKPILRQDGSRYYFETDGVDDSVSAAGFDLSVTDKVAVAVGARKASDAATGAIVGLGAGTAVATWELRGPASNGGASFGFVGRGDNATGTSEYRGLTYTAPVTNVVFCQYDIAGADRTTEILPRVNAATPGTLQTAGQTSLGGGNFSSAALNVGRRNASSTPFNGRIYRLVVVGRTLTSGERNSLESWTNTGTGAY
jgi:hypothetical protein